MKRTLTSVTMALGTAAFILATGPAVVAGQSQTPPAGGAQTSGTQTRGTQSSGASTGSQVTLTGCIQREADYRRATDAGRGGVLGTGAGTGNEFILANAMMGSSSAGQSAANSSSSTPSATGTSGASGTAYELTGPREGDAASFVGKRVEITGMVKPTGASPGGPTANAPGSQDLELRELEIASIRETSGTCTTPSSPTAR